MVLLTGRPAIDTNLQRAEPLYIWCQNVFGRMMVNIDDFVDPNIRQELTTRGSKRFATKLGRIARTCTKADPNDRPPFREIVKISEDLLSRNNFKVVDYQVPPKWIDYN